MHEYGVDWGAGEGPGGEYRFAPAGRLTDRLSHFAWNYATYVHGAGGGFGVGNPVTDARYRASGPAWMSPSGQELTRAEQFQSRMEAELPVRCRIGTTDVFERRNLFVKLTPSHLDVEVWRPMPYEAVPECLRELVQNGGRWAGMFAREHPALGPSYAPEPGPPWRGPNEAGPPG